MQKKIVVVVILILCIILGFVGFFVYRVQWVAHLQQNKIAFVPQKINTTLNPPKDAIQATVNITGNVAKLGRTDKEFQNLTKQTTTLLQGESLATKPGGSAVVTLNNIVTISLRPNTELDYLNGLADAIVLRQPSGTVTYTTIAGSKPISIRSFGLLTQIPEQTKVTITTSQSEQTVTVVVISGTATLAYSDQDDITQILKLTKGQSAFYDYTTSMLTRE